MTIPTKEDAVNGGENVEEERDTAKVPATLSKEFLSSVSQDVRIEADEDYGEAVVDKTPTVARSKPARPKDERIKAAEKWLNEYRTSRPMTRAAPSALRAYHVWYAHEGLDPAAIAALLRDPPLQTNTVVSYILEAIRLEKLPFKPTRLRAEVLALLPKEIVARRYGMLMQDTDQTTPQ